MWLVVGQMLIKTGWWDASSLSGILAEAIKHCVQFSTTNTLYISRFVIVMSAFQKQSHCVKCVQIRTFFWSVYSRIPTEYGEIRSIYRDIQSEYGKIQTRKNSVFGHFSRSDRQELLCKKGAYKNFPEFTGGVSSGTGVSCEFCDILKNTFFRKTPPVAAIEIFYSNTVCNKSAAEVWICLVSFYGGAKDLIFTCFFLNIITFFIKL